MLLHVYDKIIKSVMHIMKRISWIPIEQKFMYQKVDNVVYPIYIEYIFVFFTTIQNFSALVFFLDNIIFIVYNFAVFHTSEGSLFPDIYTVFLAKNIYPIQKRLSVRCTFANGHFPSLVNSTVHLWVNAGQSIESKSISKS
jgi:hypothetical protein